MIPAPSLDELDLMLNEDSPRGRSGYLTPIEPRIRVIGLIFIPPDTAESNTANLLYNINLLHKDSGGHFHFIIVGISQYAGRREVGRIGEAAIFYNDDQFSAFRSDIERKLPDWNYGYGLELVLVDVCGQRPQRYLDFDSAIYFKLDEIVKAEICDNVAQFLGKIIKLAREARFESAKDIRMFFTSQFGVNWLKALILSAFPKSIQKIARVTAVLGGGRSQISVE